VLGRSSPGSTDMSATCIGSRNTHCRICMQPDRCCLVRPATSPAPADASSYGPSAEEVDALREAIAVDAGRFIDLSDLICADLPVRVIPSAPIAALPPGAPLAAETILVQTSKETEHVHASRPPR
jgi:hypothetical protein